LTESVAALLVALPAPLLTTTVNSAPLSEELIVAAVV
jgi:membrane protease YdiL (CAAX protease family)